ncbi:hypothetical protein D0Y65_030426, partial [Glycine soja]
FVFPLQGGPCIICLKQGNCMPSITDNTILTFEGGLQKQLILAFRIDSCYFKRRTLAQH